MSSISAAWPTVIHSGNGYIAQCQHADETPRQTLLGVSARFSYRNRSTTASNGPVGMHAFLSLSGYRRPMTTSPDDLVIPRWTFADRLRKVRLMIGLSQDEMAERL